MSEPVLPRFLLLSEAAEIHRVNIKTIQRWIADGTLTAYRVGPHLLRVAEADVYALARPVTPGSGDAA